LDYNKFSSAHLQARRSNSVISGVEEAGRRSDTLRQSSGSFFPEMIREMIRDMLAAKGITREDLEEIIQEHEKPARLQ
jgi:hypothetical protein